MGTISINEMRIKLPDDKEVTYPQVIEWLNYVLGRTGFVEGSNPLVDMELSDCKIYIGNPRYEQ